MVKCNDKVLEQHLHTTGRNATYNSPMSQIVVIEAISTVMQTSIIDDVKETRLFSILADGTTDFSRQEQLTVCLRYVSIYGGIRERFLWFALAPDLTGLVLSTQLLQILENCDIGVINVVGQGYDGAAAMSGEKNWVHKHILDK